VLLGRDSSSWSPFFSCAIERADTFLARTTAPCDHPMLSLIVAAVTGPFSRCSCAHCERPRLTSWKSSTPLTG
jgi:hypothetical protein